MIIMLSIKVIIFLIGQSVCLTAGQQDVVTTEMEDTAASQTEFYTVSASGGGPVITNNNNINADIVVPGAAANNDTKDFYVPADSSEHSRVVFAGDTYVPVNTQLRSRPISTAEQQTSDWRSHSFEGWGDARRQGFNTTRVQHIEAECQDDYMKIRIGYNGSFGGLLYSSGYSYDPDCVYINGTGRDYYEFYIQLNRCGTLGKNSRQEDARKNPAKNLMWNTVTVQYNPMIEEEWDEHFKITCEYGYDFWKTVTFPFLDVEVATGNPVVFTLSPPECYMEIRYGYGTSGNRVAGPVRVGDPLTLIIYMRSKYDGFDIVVNDCYAHNGANKRIQLIDQYGCPVDDKLISRFRGSWSETGVFETQVFAYMKAFRFTGSPALYIECDVRMCHGRCPSQPCHWRNAKNIVRRSVDATPPPQSPVSQNVNLFQSLRVLQEGEFGEEVGQDNRTTGSYYNDGTANANTAGNANNTLCVRHGLLTALSALGSIVLCFLSLALTVTCYRVKSLQHFRLFFWR